MQGAKNKVARLRSGNGERDGLEITHFADHDNVRIFAQRSAECGSERLCVSPHFALRDVAAFRLENIFDRIFQGDDVVPPFQIHLLD